MLVRRAGHRLEAGDSECGAIGRGLVVLFEVADQPPDDTRGLRVGYLGNGTHRHEARYAMQQQEHSTRESYKSRAEDAQHSWRFVSNHTQVLLCISENPEIRLREIAARVGITERAAQRIVADLVDAGYVTRARSGRRNQYAVNRDLEMRHPAQFGHEVGALLDLLQSVEGTTVNPRPSS